MLLPCLLVPFSFDGLRHLGLSFGMDVFLSF